MCNTYTDCEGNTHDWTFTFTIERADFSVPANPDPEVIACAANLYTPAAPAVTDNCGNALTPTDRLSVPLRPAKAM